MTDSTGDTVDAQVTVTYMPTVAPDVQNGGLIGSPAVVNVLTNDTGDFDVSTLRVIDPVTQPRRAHRWSCPARAPGRSTPRSAA